MSDPHRVSSEMRATVYQAPRQLILEDCGVLEARVDEVLLHPSHCGICCTDLDMVMDG